MTDSMSQQIGGDHYKKGGIQPFALSMANGHDGCTHAIQKYLTRFGLKDGLEGLKKAHHICSIRVDLMSLYGVPHPPEKPLIGIGDYLRSNKIKPIPAAAIIAMETWFRTVDTDHGRQRDKVCRLIRHIAETHYPHTYKEKDFL